MKKGLLLIGVMMLTLSASAQKFWTLQDCIDYAMENNITLQKSKLDKSRMHRRIRTWDTSLGKTRGWRMSAMVL